ncbi:ABC transporter ATP-binding protein [Noviherbaspirillum sedimenti]|uniref:ABC transporter ATP-binding protein n=2 Tax=Noviherbaspirillum sedimenti TaxID=2320865 RepID=A0A3A3GTP2_9BURK|nr:ABC transporter ATP-binding protein [Noviherbaspirillum sedimenti]RJG04380.1 ABC transporter ATP-binding protein [Noviherbaspirillum sedimenti]
MLRLAGISHSYQRTDTFSDLSFTLGRGQIGCLLGPSGCGKTTALRCIAGFESISAGAIHVNGRLVSNHDFSMPAEQRHIGMVFQDYALFPHLDVRRNVAFGLRGLDRDASRRRVDEMLEVVGLQTLGKAYPHELSGGQQQRVALARALAPQPDLLLLDEPFSNLDVELRERLSVEVRAILKQQNTTAVLVTHDQHEAFAIADEIGILHHGVIQQWDTPYKLYHEPANRFVADFIGEGVLVPGVVAAPDMIEIELGAVPARMPQDCCLGCTVDVLVRPDDLIHDDASPLQAAVVSRAFRGAEFLYTLELPSGTRVLSLVPSHHNHALGEKIGIRLEIDHVVAFRR